MMTRFRASLYAIGLRFAVLTFVVLLVVSLASGLVMSVLVQRLLTEWILSNATARVEGLAYGPHLQGLFEALPTSGSGRFGVATSAASSRQSPRSRASKSGEPTRGCCGPTSQR